jgi:hypothetical protein
MKAGFPEVFGLLVVIGSAYLMFGRSAPLGASDIIFLLVILSITYFVLRLSETRGKSHRN